MLERSGPNVIVIARALNVNVVASWLNGNFNARLVCCLSCFMLCCALISLVRRCEFSQFTICQS